METTGNLLRRFIVLILTGAVLRVQGGRGVEEQWVLRQWGKLRGGRVEDWRRKWGQREWNGRDKAAQWLG